MTSVTGELGGQPILLENAATEATLQALLQATLSNSSNKSQAAKIQKAYEDALQKTTKQQTENIDSLKKQQRLLKEEEKNRSDLNKKIEEEKEKREKFIRGLDELGQVIGKTVSFALSSATPKITDFTDALSGIPILGPIIGAVGKGMQDTVDKFRLLSTVGADFGSSIHGMREAARLAGISLETYSNIVVQNSKDLALLGGSTNAGVKVFTRLNQSIREGFGQQLGRLGFSMEEQSELTMAYLAQQTRLGRAQLMTDQELTNSTYDYMIELDRLARVTGQTRKEAQASLDKMEADKRVKSMFAAMGAGAKDLKSFLSAVRAVPEEGEQMYQAFVDLLANNGVASGTNEMAESIFLNNQELVRMLMALKNRRIGEQEAFDILRKNSRANAQLLPQMGNSISLYKNQNSAIFDIIPALTAFTNIGLEAAAAAEEQGRVSRHSSKDMANMDTALLDLRYSLLQVLLPGIDMLSEFLSNNVDTLKTLVEDVVTKIQSYIETAMGPGGIGAAIRQALGDLGNVLKPFFKDLFREIITSPTVIGGVMMGFAALLGYAGLKAALVKSLTDAVNSAKGGPRPGQYGNWGDMKPEGPTSKLPGRGIGRLGGLLRGGGVGLLGAGVEYAGEKLTEAGHTKTGAALDIAGSTAKYAGMGAMVGSIVPGLGTAVGAGVGGLFGLGAGLWSSGSKLFGGDKKSEVPSGDTAVAANVARTTTPAQVKELSAALKELDYSKLIIPDTAHASMETGVIKMRQLRGEVLAMTSAFKDLNNTGLDKITAGLGRLDESFKSFNKSFVEDFITKFKELDKKSQETLLSDLNGKMDQLNSSVRSLVEITEDSVRYGKHTANNTKRVSGSVN